MHANGITQEEVKRFKKEKEKRQKRKELANKQKYSSLNSYLGYIIIGEDYLYFYQVKTKIAKRFSIKHLKQRGCEDFFIGPLYFIIGGSVQPKWTRSVNVEKDFEIEKRANMKVGRYFMDSNTTDNRHIYVMGGRNPARCFSSCEKYFIEQNKWTMIKPMNVARDCMSSGVMDYRYIYVIEGRNDTGFIRSIERLDTLDEDQGWILFYVYPNSLPRTAKCGCWCIQINNSELLIAGGTRTFNDKATSDVWTFNTNTTEMKPYRQNLPIEAELYTPAILYKGWYYQVKYCYKDTKLDLIRFSTVLGNFEITPFKSIWRKKTL